MKIISGPFPIIEYNRDIILYYIVICTHTLTRNKWQYKIRHQTNAIAKRACWKVAIYFIALLDICKWNFGKNRNGSKNPDYGTTLSRTLVICSSFPLIRELNVEGNWYFHNLAAFPPANSSVFAEASLEVTISSYLFPGRNLPTCLLAYRGTSRELEDSAVVQNYYRYDFAICDFCYARNSTNVKHQ